MLSGRGKCEKLTKINILHVTINYIRAMENLLTTGDSGVNSYSEMVRNPIRPDEAGGKHKKFEECDAAVGPADHSAATAVVRIPKKAKNGGGEIRDGRWQTLIDEFQIELPKGAIGGSKLHTVGFWVGVPHCYIAYQ